MKRILSLLLCLALLGSMGFAEEFLALEEEFALAAEEEPVREEEERFEAAEEALTVSEEELIPEEATEQIEEIIQTAPEEAPVAIAEALEEEDIAGGTWGTCAWEIGADGVLTIHAGTGADTGNQCPWLSWAEQITAVVCREAVVLPACSSSLFNGLSSCASIDLSGADTGGVTNMESMFFDCFRLTGLDVSGFDTGSVTNMNYLFCNCASLTSLDLSGFDTGSVSSMRSMMNACSSLERVTLGERFTFRADNGDGQVMGTLTGRSSRIWYSRRERRGYSESDIASSRGKIRDTYTTSLIDEIGYGTWGSCEWEIGLDGVLRIHAGTGRPSQSWEDPVNPWYPYRSEIAAVSAVEPIRALDCTDLFAWLNQCTEMDLSGFDTAEAASLARMFSGCSALTSLDLSGFDTSRTESMSGMFDSCASLTEINLSGFDTRNVTNMSRMFSGCTSLAELDLSGFDTGRVYDNDSMFFRCAALSLVRTGSGFSFRSLMSTTSYAPLPDKTWYAASTNMPCTAEEIALTRSGIADAYSTTPWGDAPFVSAAGVWGTCAWTIDFDGVLTICAGKGTDTGAAARPGWYEFRSGITALRLQGTVVFPEKASMVFEGLENCASMDLTGADTSHTKSFYGMFSRCSSLTALDLSAFDTSGATDMQFMFTSCTRLTGLDVSGFDTSRVETMYMMFMGCDSIRELDLSGFATPLVRDMGHMFYDCVRLERLDLSGFDTAKTQIMNSMFEKCAALKSVTLGSGFSFSGAKGSVLTTLPEKTWFAQSDNRAYTALQLAQRHGGAAETYSDAPSLETPGAVTGLKGQPVDTNASRLTWSAVRGADGYQLWRSENGGAFKWIKNCTTAVVNNYSLTPGAAYSYKVRAYTEMYGFRAYGPFSAEVSVHILGEIKNFTVTGKDTNCAFLRWDAVAGCTGYQVFRTVAGSGEYTWVKNASTPQVANYSLTPGTTYYYKIRAYIDLPGGKRAYGQYSDGVKVCIQPQVKVKLTAGDRQITIAWDKADGATGYQIFYTEAGTGGEYRWWKNIPAGTLTATLTSLKANTDYWFKVRSYVDLPDGGRSYGQLSEAVHIWTK